MNQSSLNFWWDSREWSLWVVYSAYLRCIIFVASGLMARHGRNGRKAFFHVVLAVVWKNGEVVGGKKYMPGEAILPKWRVRTTLRSILARREGRDRATLHRLHPLAGFDGIRACIYQPQNVRLFLLLILFLMVSCNNLQIRSKTKNCRSRSVHSSSESWESPCGTENELNLSTVHCA